MCVYCGSRPGKDEAFAATAEAVGTWIGRHGGQLVYGGGKSGLMGMVARATRDAGGRVVAETTLGIRSSTSFFCSVGSSFSSFCTSA